ncbi:unnamed protein product [Caenorhabditis auriculariae]|uniref:Prokaryotic-type class I peptide chain release factors domain-containing protein n=1 Tax=Caenorhabditis auriculariae TaxID=2777116 RepID=A0A8S1HJ30_9PELO|nr:unnamed protein product [Caenorhabditis auriculariae]
MHRTIRLASSIRSLLKSEKAERVLSQIERHSRDSQTGLTTVQPEMISYWQMVAQDAALVREKFAEVQQLSSIIEEDSADAELISMAKEERSMVRESLDRLLDELAVHIVPTTEIDVLSKCQIELTSGAGGQEAMLFTGELLDMYAALAQNNGWKWEPFQVDSVALGGVRSALVAVSGSNVYSTLRFEAGVHRVQRVPINDTRMHTSTSSVSVLPEPEEISVIVPSDSVKIETMRASGPGGQNVNKRSTAVRMTHKETGIAVHCMDERFQHLNIQIAYKRLAAILMQRQVDAMNEKTTSDRRLQVGSKARAEKIRTYNFQHDRVTDHRIQMTIKGVEEFLRGGTVLQSMIDRLTEQHLEDRLKHFLDTFELDQTS